MQFAVFDPKPFLTNWFYKLGYHTLAVIFAILVAIYAWAAFSPGRDFSDLRPALHNNYSGL